MNINKIKLKLIIKLRKKIYQFNERQYLNMHGERSLTLTNYPRRIS